MSPHFIGILPAAGQAKRLHPFRYPKELLPIAFAPEPEGGGVRPIPVAEYSLRSFALAGVRQCLIVIADWKTEMIRYFGDGGDLGLRIAYLNQSEARGLADAIDLGYDWVRDAHVCLALPDTIIRPISAMSVICKALAARQDDLVLGVFPTAIPQQLGPVRIAPDGSVREVQDKPAQTDLRNTWGIAAWSPRFTRLVHDSLSSADRDAHAPIGHFFHRAATTGLRVSAVWFEDGDFLDVGLTGGIGKLVLSPEDVSGFVRTKE